MNVYERLLQVVRETPERAALVDGFGRQRQVLTFRELDARAAAVARRLRAHGLRAGDRVLLAVPMSAATFVVMLALIRAGMVVMVIDAGHSARRVADILEVWPPRAVISTRTIWLLRALLPELARAPFRFCLNGRMPGTIRLDIGSGPEEATPVVSRKAADSAVLSFTSGSTGMPKAVSRSHGFLGRQLDMIARVADVQDGDVDFVAMPMFVLFNLVSAMTSVIPACDLRRPASADPATVIRQIRSENVNRLVASPALLERLADHCLRRNLQLPGLRQACTGGGPVSPFLAQRFSVVAPNCRFRMVYGSTEAEPIAVIDHEHVSARDREGTACGNGLLAGRPVQGCDVRILRSVPARPGLDAAEFEGLTAGAGEPGEIVVAGPHVLDGYADAARNAETKLNVDGRIWHRTGDAGYVDTAGRLWLLGRASAAIDDSRGIVYPFQVEYALRSIPGIGRAALLQRDGERTVVIEHGGRAIRGQCRALARCVERFQIDTLVQVARLPMDRRHNAKVDYPALQRMLDGRWFRARLAVAEWISEAFVLLRAISRHAVRSLPRTDPMGSSRR